MADNYTISLIGAMDSLWFHQLILFPEPNSLLVPKTMETTVSVSESFAYGSSCGSILEEDILLEASPVSSNKDDSENEETDQKETKTAVLKLNVVANKTSGYLSSPSAQKRLRNRRYLGSVMRLQKTMSCKTLCELEVEEVKGFMDLGFRFNKDDINPRMMSVVPGLQRLGSGGCGSSNEENDDDIAGDDEEEEEKGVMRPYLSEAWLIKKPDSPLLNLRIPRVSTAANMKKHLKSWARTVASVIQQES